MATLTRDQVRKLTPEQQEALGSAVAQRVRTRQQLVDRARGRGLKGVIGAVLFMGLSGGLIIYCTASPRDLPFALIAIFCLVAFLVAGVHRRLDALMQLLELDGEINKDEPKDRAELDQAD